jgi:hypothetical protein
MTQLLHVGKIGAVGLNKLGCVFDSFSGSVATGAFLPAPIKGLPGKGVAGLTEVSNKLGSFVGVNKPKRLRAAAHSE